MKLKISKMVLAPALAGACLFVIATLPLWTCLEIMGCWKPIGELERVLVAKCAEIQRAVENDRISGLDQITKWLSENKFGLSEIRASSNGLIFLIFAGQSKYHVYLIPLKDAVVPDHLIFGSERLSNCLYRIRGGSP